jgi:hypothetical protein
MAVVKLLLYTRHAVSLPSISRHFLLCCSSPYKEYNFVRPENLKPLHLPEYVCHFPKVSCNNLCFREVGLLLTVIGNTLVV